jgi:hypothetical protein
MAAFESRLTKARRVLAIVNVIVLTCATALLIVHGLRRNSGPAVNTAPTGTPVVLTTVPNLPHGATPCDRIYTGVTAPFNAAARGSPMTSCPFVEQVRLAYAEQALAASDTIHITVVSPTTRKFYELDCRVTGSYVTCAGGQYAIIYLYNR